jgi:hypothetical protein
MPAILFKIASEQVRWNSYLTIFLFWTEIMYQICFLKNTARCNYLLLFCNPGKAFTWLTTKRALSRHRIDTTGGICFHQTPPHCWTSLDRSRLSKDQLLWKPGVQGRWSGNGTRMEPTYTWNKWDMTQLASKYGVLLFHGRTPLPLTGLEFEHDALRIVTPRSS